MSPSLSPRLAGTFITAPPERTVLRRLFPEPAASLAAEDVYADVSRQRTLPEKTRGLPVKPYVLINMVSSLDGKATASGKAGPIGSPTDRLLMRALRAHADAVLTGAGTLRAEKLALSVPENLSRSRVSRGLEPQPLAVVATTTGDVPLGTNLICSSPDNLLVLVSSETSEESLAALSSLASVEVVAANTTGPGVDPIEALSILKSRHAVDLLLVEGGPALNHALVSAGLADELFLTLSPKLLGDVGPETLTILEGPPVPSHTVPKLVSVHLFGDELFLRYALRPPVR